MRKMIAILLCLCLLLCGCGNEAAPTSESTSAAPEESVVVSEISAEAEEIEEASIHEDGGPTDPVELAKWVWALADEASEACYAADYDVSMLMEIDVNGEYTSSQSSIRTKEITTDDGSIVYTKSTSDGETSESWYGDGMFYQSSVLGNYKVPMTYEEYEAQEEDDTESNPLADISPENFGKLFATRMDQGYGVNFSEPTLETWMAFSDMFTSEDQESYTCEAFDLEGYMQCDEEGNVTQVKLDMTVTLDIMGIPMTMVISMNQLTMGYDEKVSIELPAEDSSYIELADLSIPTAMAASQLITAAQPALQYQRAWVLTLEYEVGMEIVIETDDIAYSTGEDGLSAVWNYNTNINGEPDYWSTEYYAGGSSTIIDETGEETYSTTDELYLDFISDYTALYTYTFPYGSDFVTGDDAGFATLTYTLSDEYIEETLLSALSNYSVDHFLTDGTVQSMTGTGTIWFNSVGLIISQLSSISIEVEYEGETIILSLQDACDIVATGDDVVVEIPEATAP